METQSQRKLALDDSWRGFGGLHGGLVTALLLDEATRDTAPGQLPTSVTTQFLAPVEPGLEVGFDVDHVHLGRRTCSVAVRLRQQGRVSAHALVGLGTVGPPPLWDEVRPLTALPSPLDLPRFQPPIDLVPAGQHFDIRPVDGVVPGAAADRPAYETWIRMREAEQAARLGPHGAAAVLLDALPPGLLALWTAPRRVPTSELTIHFAGASALGSEWLHVRSRTVWSAGRTSFDHTELRTDDGRLVAQATQTRLVL